MKFDEPKEKVVWNILAKMFFKLGFTGAAYSVWLNFCGGKEWIKDLGDCMDESVLEKYGIKKED